MSKGGGGGGPSEQTVVNTSLPEYAEPFYRDLLARVGYESAVPYESYPGKRLEYFSPAEQEAMRRFEQLGVSGTSPELRAAGDIAAQVGQGNPYASAMLDATNRAQYTSGYDAGYATMGYLPSTVEGDGGMFEMLPDEYSATTRDSEYTAGTFDPGYDPTSRDSGFDARDPRSRYRAGTFDPGYEAGDLSQDYTARNLRSRYSGEMDTGPGFRPGSVASPGVIDRYMSPYQQLVVDREKEEAVRQSEKMGQQLGLQAAGSGSLGGYREAIMQAERQRNLEDQLGDIQAAGSQQAFQQAMQGYEADRAARLQAGQLGLQTGQAQQQALQEAERFRQSAFGQTEAGRQQQQQLEMGVYQAGEAARREAAQMGLNAQQQEDAARQAQEKFRQSGFQLGSQERQFQEQSEQQAFQFAEQARQRAAEMGLTAQQQEDAAQQAMERYKQSAEQQRQSAMSDANRFNLDRFQAGIGALQSAEALRLQQFQANQAAQQRQEELSRLRRELAARTAQSAYGQLLSGDQQRLAAAGMMGDFVGQRQQMEMERLRAMQTAGEIQRNLLQRGLDIGYTDFLRQQAFPKEQLSFYSSMLQGVPIAPGQVSQSYGITPSTTQQLLGAGIASAGLYGALGGFGGR